MVARYFGATDRGTTRTANEDDFLIAELSQTVAVRQAKIAQPEVVSGRDRAYLFMVADGMGGHAAGSLASVTAVGEVTASLANMFPRMAGGSRPTDEAVLDELRQAVERADAHLFDEAEDTPGLEGMGTTLTLALVLCDRLYLAHAGDSRAYRLRAGGLERLTTDHTVAVNLARQGVITPAEADGHRYRRVLNNVLGGFREGVCPELVRVDVRAGDVLLLCTDGLTAVVPDAHIARILATVGDPRAACEQLLAAAIRRATTDNVTVVVARFDGR